MESLNSTNVYHLAQFIYFMIRAGLWYRHVPVLPCLRHDHF
jgi:hypothetical protein